MFVVRPARMLSSAALFCVAVPAVAAAQGPLAGLVSRVIAESTINRSQPNQPVVHEPHFLVGESLARSARQMNVELGAQLLSFPLGSSSGGFSFTTNSMTGEVSMSSETFGPAFAERAITLGKGQTNIGFAFQSTSYDSFEGVGARLGRSSPSSGSTTTAAPPRSATRPSRRTSRRNSSATCCSPTCRWTSARAPACSSRPTA